MRRERDGQAGPEQREPSRGGGAAPGGRRHAVEAERVRRAAARVPLPGPVQEQVGPDEQPHPDQAVGRDLGPAEERDVGQPGAEPGPGQQQGGHPLVDLAVGDHGVEEADHEHRDQRPAGVVGQRDARHARQPGLGVGEDPVPGRGHLRVEVEVPRREAEPAGSAVSAARAPVLPRGRAPRPREQRPGQPAAEQEHRPRHHRPGQRDDDGDVEHLPAERAGVLVGAEREARRRAHGLGDQAAPAGDQEHEQGGPRAGREGGVDQAGGAEQQDRRDGHEGEDAAAEQRVRDLHEDRGTGQHQGQQLHRCRVASAPGWHPASVGGAHGSGSAATTALVPPVVRTSSSWLVGYTVRGWPAAAHTSSKRARSASTRVGSGRR